MSADADVDILHTAQAGPRVVRGSMLRVLSFGTGALFTAIASVLLLRHLGLVEFGRYATVMAIIAIAAGISDAGLTMVGTREMSLLPRGPQRMGLLADLLGLRMVLTPLAAAVGVSFAALAGYSPVLIAGTALAGAGLVLFNMQTTFMMLPAVELRNVRVSLAEIVRQALMLAGVALLVALGAELSAFFALHIAVALGLLLVTPALVGRRGLTGPQLHRKRALQLLMRGLPVAAAYALAVIYFRVLLLILSVTGSEADVGAFGTSLRIFELLIGVPTIAIGVALPVLSAAAGDKVRFGYQVDRLVRSALFLGGLIAVTLALGARPVVEILGGSEFAPAADILRVHIAAFVPVFLGAVASTALIALGAQRMLVLANGTALVVMVALGLLLVPAEGAHGAALAAIAGELALAILLFASLRRAAPSAMPRATVLLPVVPAVVLSLSVGLVPGLPDAAAAAIGGLVFLIFGLLFRAIPAEIFDALRPRKEVP